MFVSHRNPRVTVVARTARGWEEREYRAQQTVTLENPKLAFGVDELYAGITLDEA